MWPISLHKEISTLKVVGNKKMFAPATGQVIDHSEFADAGDAEVRSFDVTDVTKPPLGASSRGGTRCASDFIQHAKGGKIPMRKKGGSHVIDIEVT